MPKNPYDPDLYAADLLIDGPEGRLSFPAFFMQPMELMDAGDSEIAQTAGPGLFIARWRPRLPGRYRLQLQINEQGRSCIIPLPDADLSGPASDPFIKVDPNDKRFFSSGDGAPALAPSGSSSG
jgi:hypothetical protein